MRGLIDLERDSRLRANRRASSICAYHELADGIMCCPVALGPADRRSLPGLETDIANAPANVSTRGGSGIGERRACLRMRDVQRAFDAADGFVHTHPDWLRLALVVDIKPRNDLGTCIQERLLDAEQAGSAHAPRPENLAAHVTSIVDLPL